MKTLRMILSREQMIEALGNYVAFQHGVEHGRATANVMFTYEILPESKIEIRQARVEITLEE